jgi:pyruvate dehydrogenase E1 component alpha subunit
MARASAKNKAVDLGSIKFTPGRADVTPSAPPTETELDMKLGRKLRKELGDERLLKMFEDMCRLRRFEEHAGRAYQRRKIKGFCHLYIGQEAVAVGAMHAITDDDYIVTHYREHGHALARGMESNGVMAELFGKKAGCSGGKGGSMHLFDAERKFLGGWWIVGGQISLAAGVAFASKYRGENAVCLSFLGEGAIHQGIVHETLNLAALWGLPLVTIVENNRYGMGTAMERVSAVKDLRKKALSYDMVAETCDGQDIFETYETMKRAVDRARNDGQPTFLDVSTYRYRGHSMTDPGDYRTKDEVEKQQDLRDPIVRLRNWLIAAKVADAASLEAIDAAMEEESKAAVEFADKAEQPDPSELTSDIYVEWPWDIE